VAKGKLKILYVHRGVEGSDGWGRSFFLATGLVKLGHDVAFMTIKKSGGLGIEKKRLEGVDVVSFPEILPGKLKSSGFGLFSLIFKSFFSIKHRFDLVISDCGHRPSVLPAFLSQYLRGATHISEWWDLYGEGGYYSEKPFYFRVFYGKFEKWFELKSKKLADGIIVLSSWMFQKAKDLGLRNIAIVRGGALTTKLKYFPPTDKSKNRKLVVAYLGMAVTELELLRPVFEAFSEPSIKNKVELWGFGRQIPQQKLEEYGIEDVLVEKGWVDYLSDTSAINEVDIFLMVRKVNDNALAGWPNKLGDYLALGRPVLIHPYGDLVEFVTNHKEGFILVEFEKQSIIDALENVLSNNYDLLEMGKKNRELAESISWERKSAEILAFFDQINQTKNKKA
jgi:glycosyltransferase involved in cell wall biosynthesis